MFSATQTNKELAQLPALKRLREAQEKLLRDCSDGDISVQCGDKTWKCSAMILAQRCDFSRVATSGVFKESKTKVIKLEQETKEEVDMLLLYLYTLDDPQFDDKKLFADPFSGARSALKLGDKYNLPDLTKAGEQWLLPSIQRLAVVWQHNPADKKESWVQFLRSIWDMGCVGAEPVKEATTKSLAIIGKDIIEHETFQKFCAEKPHFAIAFMPALVAKK